MGRSALEISRSAQAAFLTAYWRVIMRSQRWARAMNSERRFCLADETPEPEAADERGSILLTSNRSPSEWAEVFGDALLASAALDRLTHHARVTVIAGESYRQRHRRKEAEPTTPTPKKQ